LSFARSQVAVFSAPGTAAGESSQAGGIVAPWLFGFLIGTGFWESGFLGYAFGAALMLIAAVVAALFAVRAERASLEHVARPLAAEYPQHGAGGA
jgi:hypothetical protein